MVILGFRKLRQKDHMFKARLQNKNKGLRMFSWRSTSSINTGFNSQHHINWTREHTPTVPAFGRYRLED